MFSRKKPVPIVGLHVADLIEDLDDAHCPSLHQGGRSPHLGRAEQAWVGKGVDDGDLAPDVTPDEVGLRRMAYVDQWGRHDAVDRAAPADDRRLQDDVPRSLAEGRIAQYARLAR
jgi:hypothetical protein